MVESCRRRRSRSSAPEPTAPNVFAIGDATNLPTSKAVSATHFEGETLTASIERFLEGKGLEGSYDGQANCFVETGIHKALLIDFNYEVEPLPGRYMPGIGAQMSMAGKQPAPIKQGAAE